MSISSHARCDNCERKLIPLDEESVTEDYLLDAGWVCVKWSDVDEDERGTETLDFCGFECASRWCAREDNTGETKPPVQSREEES